MFTGGEGPANNKLLEQIRNHKQRLVKTGRLEDEAQVRGNALGAKRLEPPKLPAQKTVEEIRQQSEEAYQYALTEVRNLSELIAKKQQELLSAQEEVSRIIIPELSETQKRKKFFEEQSGNAWKDPRPGVQAKKLLQKSIESLTREISRLEKKLLSDTRALELLKPKEKPVRAAIVEKDFDENDPRYKELKASLLEKEKVLGLKNRRLNQYDDDDEEYEEISAEISKLKQDILQLKESIKKREEVLKAEKQGHNVHKKKFVLNQVIGGNVGAGRGDLFAAIRARCKDAGGNAIDAPIPAVSEAELRMKRQVEEARVLEVQLYGEQHTPTYEHVSKEWWSNEVNVNAYLQDLQSQLASKNVQAVAESEAELRMKRQVEEARALEVQLYGEQRTPSYEHVSKEWWSDEGNVNAYLQDLQSQLRIRKQIEEAQVLVRQLSIEPGIKGNVERAHELERQLYGMPVTPAYERVSKEWWSSESNVNSYFEELQTALKVRPQRQP